MNNVPYISQHWQKSCTSLQLEKYTQEFVDTWSHKSCGLACIAMILHFFDKSEGLPDLFEDAYKSGYYTPKGWIHNGLVEMLNIRGVQGCAKAANKNDIMQGIKKGSLYIVSVSYKFPINGEKGGHLVLVFDIDDNNQVYFNDPSTWGESNQKLNADVFFSSYSGRCIEVNNEIL